MNEANSKTDEAFYAIQKEHTEDEWNDALFLHDYAFSVEDTNILLAYKLMERAQKLRPAGPIIIKKLAEYKLQIQNESSSIPKVDVSEKNITIKDKCRAYIKKPIVQFVIIPWLLLALYQALWASERFESISQVIVKQPDSISTLSPELSLLSGFGVAGRENDADLMKAYIESVDMLNYLDNKLNLKEHYENTKSDFFSRLSQDSTKEDFFEFYLKHISINVDSLSGIINIHAQGFNEVFSYELNKAIIERAEWYINEIGHELANKQVSFISQEYELAKKRLKEAQVGLLSFQQKHNLLDPESEGAALQGITFGLEGQIASVKAELSALNEVMSSEAIEVRVANNQLKALESQLLKERQRLSQVDGSSSSMSEVLSTFTNLKVNFELTLQGYSSSLISLEKSRVEAYRQLKYLITIQTATLPESSAYPDIFYNICLIGVILLLVFGIVRLILATVNELK